LSGQDSGRGTFSQRHAVLYDTQTGKAWEPLAELRSEHTPRGRFEVFDSSLSEAGVLGFEYGYSVVAGDALVMWEAQFGDFNNVAQSIIDQYVAASEDKWQQRSRLTMLLPHGFICLKKITTNLFSTLQRFSPAVILSPTCAPGLLLTVRLLMKS